MLKPVQQSDSHLQTTASAPLLRQPVPVGGALEGESAVPLVAFEQPENGHAQFQGSVINGTQCVELQFCLCVGVLCVSANRKYVCLPKRSCACMLLK